MPQGSLPHLVAFMANLRDAYRRGPEAFQQFLDGSVAALNDSDERRRVIRAELARLLTVTNWTHALTEVGILDDESITHGVLRRLGRRVAPAPERSLGLDTALAGFIQRGDGEMIQSLSVPNVVAWLDAVMRDDQAEWETRRQLSSTLVILATRVAGSGLDPRLSERMPALERWNSPFLALSRRVDAFAGKYEAGNACDDVVDATLAVVNRCQEQVTQFREEKQTLGTTLHLSSTSLRMMQQLERLETLIRATKPSERTSAVARLALSLLVDLSHPSPTRRFVGQKIELVAYLVVGHAAQKGDKYAVRSRSEYWKFWKKSLVGGLIVGLFACAKLKLSRDGLALLPQAFIYGFNYAACFVLIHLMGATLATKQPALTASRIADALEESPEQESFPELIRSIWHSQFVSFLGNMAGASVCALAVALAFVKVTGTALITPDEAAYLAKKLHPLKSGSLFYAAIAGVMLSLAGFMAGFVDNGVIFHRLGDRVAVGAGVFRLFPRGLRKPIAERLEKNAGVLTGNVALGFMLGSAGTFGILLGVPFDIRHIAFGSSHGALAIAHAPELLTVANVAIVSLSVALIGFVNFIVSFSLTLIVAINARRLEGIGWRAAMRGVLALFRSRPVAFLLPLQETPKVEPTEPVSAVP